MSDGPNILALFTEMKCLNGQSNAKEIVQYLRFFKDQTYYPTYLRHYVPMLPAELAKEFLPDLIATSPATDEDVASIECCKDGTCEKHAEKDDVPTESEAPKKRGRKPKVSLPA